MYNHEEERPSLRVEVPPPEFLEYLWREDQKRREEEKRQEGGTVITIDIGGGSSSEERDENGVITIQI